MKRVLLLAMVLACLLCGEYAHAAAGHYVSGVEGIRVSSVPPPGGSGFYWKMYNVFYNAGKMKTNSGGKAPGNFDVSVYALSNRFIYSSDIEILGGNLLWDVIIPVTFTDISYKGIGAASFSDNRWGLGDIYIDPVFIGWHGKQWDATAAFGVYLPTGEYDSDRPASPGMGFWTFMFSAGGTLYFDEAKTWSASLLARYEIHTEQRQTDITPGNHFHFEYGIGKNISGFDIGVAGYCHWQVTDDSGPGTNSNREQAHAIGPEIGYTFDNIGLTVQLRSVWEFENKNKAQGNVTSVNFLYAF